MVETGRRGWWLWCDEAVLVVLRGREESIVS